MTEIKIGRVASNDLVLAERGVSSQHARIQFDGNQLILTDLGSTNGTFVNGHRIYGAHPIDRLDEVFVCHIKLEIELPDPPALALPPFVGPAAFDGPPEFESLVVSGFDGPPVLDEPPVLDGPPVLEGPATLADDPPRFAGTRRGAPIFDGPPVLDEVPAPLFVGAPPAPVEPVIDLSVSRALTMPSVRALPLRDDRSAREWTARGAVFHELLAELGASVEAPPEPGEKQRRAARVGAKRRLAVIVRDSPELELAELGSEADSLLAELFELGPLTGLFDDPSVRELVIHGPQRIVVDRGQGRTRFDGGFSCPDAVRLVVRRWLGGSVAWGPGHPWLDHRMADGTWLRGADASVAPGGPVVVITRPRLAASVGLGQVDALPQPIAEFLGAALRARASVLVCLGRGCDGNVLASACAHELAAIDPSRLGIVRAAAKLTPPTAGLVLDAEPGLTSSAIQLAIDAGSTALILHQGGGAGLAHAWAGLDRGLTQLVVTVTADEPEAGLAACVAGLRRGGYGLDLPSLRDRIAVTIDVIVVLARDAHAAEVPIWLGEIDDRGRLTPSVSRASPERPWQHHQNPTFVAELARRGVRFDPAGLASLSHP